MDNNFNNQNSNYSNSNNDSANSTNSYRDGLYNRSSQKTYGSEPNSNTFSGAYRAGIGNGNFEGSGADSGRGPAYRSAYDQFVDAKPVKEKKPHPFAKLMGKTVAVALAFSLVTGGVYYGVYSFTGGSKPVAAVENTIPSDRIAELPSLNKANEESVSAAKQGAASNGVYLMDVSNLVEEAMPSVVAITNISQQYYYTWFGQAQSYDSKSAGSGFIVSQDDNYIYIATNNHVVSGAESLTVQFCDDTTAAAEIQGTSDNYDIAVIKVKLSDISSATKGEIKVAKINDSGNVKVGEPAIAIGNALGYGQSVTVGYISALERVVTTQDEYTGETTTNTLMQTDAAINPGNSGGALLNAKGEVIGINSAKYSSNKVEGMGLAIPMSTAAPVIENLISGSGTGAGSEAYIGINGLEVSDSVSSQYNIPTGIFITGIIEGTGAEAAGIQQGDIIVKFNGKPVTTMENLSELLSYMKPGDTVPLVIARADNGKYVEHTINVVLSEKN
ncbi:MAG: trypsin-like peptidase domain-containing protein [Lachnospiraceae bacterium]|nr:trypsin-like peptidase domain-containing protein [Lachnospiraceae bacterium]